MGFQARALERDRVKQSVFATAATTAMVCWLCVGSALFFGVFAILGGQQLVEQWVLSFNLSPSHAALNRIFAGMMPCMLVVILCMVVMYLWPRMTLWLPNYLCGGGAN